MKPSFIHASKLFETPPLGAGELAALTRIDALRGRTRYFVASSPRRWLGPMRRVLAARAIQGSNTIEGFNVSVDDAVAAVEGREPASPPGDDWRATLGYTSAMTYVLQLADDPHFAYTAQLLRSLHYMMTQHFIAEAGPGLWRPGPIWVHNDLTGDVVYEGPDPGLVPALVDALVERLAADHATPAIVRAAMAHLNLAMIHPFRDGNGRMARCLQTLVLAREQILSPELCSIEEYLGRNTQQYYAVLAEVGGGRWQPERDAMPWVRFCLMAHYVQAMSVLRRIRESGLMWQGCLELIEANRLPNRAAAGLFDAGMGLTVRNSAYRVAVSRSFQEGISTQVATDDLGAMVRAGLLRAHGARRGAFYTMAEPLERLRESARRDRLRLDPSDLFDPVEASPADPEPGPGDAPHR